MGRLVENMGSDASASFLRKNHTFWHLVIDLDMERWK
jgi:hypothetical protein